ncbi:cell wall hydrolase [Parvibaculum sp.]|uniref:cell wall hydrolase n=1 Tax=Parvibaculum sp. TaxID=2024848 RepID=UPI001DDC7B65|nr:cell wall hydrolase [Parvibaculum sp.]MBX3487852.1 cell wall hydrolase [Parvibaculum sp.]
MADNLEDAVLIGGIFTAMWAFIRGRRKVAEAAQATAAAAPATPPVVGGFEVAPGFENPFGTDPFGLGQSAPYTSDFVNSFFGIGGGQAAAPAVDPVEKDWLARTLWGEARGEGKAGQRAVAAVIMNRVASRRYPGTVQGVVRAPYQFSMWNAGEPNGTAARAVTEADAQFRSCLDVAEEALTGHLADPTGGALHYYSPTAMVPPGSVPSWAKPPAKLSAIVGRHHFWIGVA